jgi:hypothetical protein
MINEKRTSYKSKDEPNNVLRGHPLVVVTIISLHHYLPRNMTYQRILDRSSTRMTLAESTCPSEAHDLYPCLYINGNLRHGHFIMTNQAMMATVKLAEC